MQKKDERRRIIVTRGSGGWEGGREGSRLLDPLKRILLNNLIIAGEILITVISKTLPNRSCSCCFSDFSSSISAFSFCSSCCK